MSAAEVMCSAYADQNCACSGTYCELALDAGERRNHRSANQDSGLRRDKAVGQWALAERRDLPSAAGLARVDPTAVKKMNMSAFSFLWMRWGFVCCRRGAGVANCCWYACAVEMEARCVIPMCQADGF